VGGDREGRECVTERLTLLGRLTSVVDSAVDGPLKLTGRFWKLREGEMQI